MQENSEMTGKKINVNGVSPQFNLLFGCRKLTQSRREAEGAENIEEVE